MKKYIYSIRIFTVSLLLVLAAGCEKDFIELEARDELPAHLALNNIEGLEATMLQVIQGVSNIHMSPEVSFYKQAGTDIVRAGTNLVDAAAGGMRGMQSYDAGLSAASPQIAGIWDTYYGALNRCLRVIEGAEVIEPRNSQEAETILRFKGEAHVMLSYLYLELVRRWDNIPLSTLLPEGQEPSLDAPLVPKSVVYDTIVANCIKAVEILPYRMNTPGVAAPSKGLANLLLAEAYLDMGVYDKAAAAAEEVINDPSYTLQPLDNIFGLSGGKTGEENNNEIIFSLTWDPNNVSREHMYAQMYVPLYDRITGVARTMASGGRPWGRFSPSEHYWDLFKNEDGSWNYEDGRLEAWHKLYWTFDDEDNLPAGKNLGDIVTVEDVEDEFGEGSIQTRYIEPTTTKHWEDGTYGRTVDDAGGWRNVIVYRYANAYLLGAEAYWKDGNDGRALELLNELRERAYGNTDHDLTSLSEEIFLAEHARELGHEGHRWNLLKRMGVLIDRVRLYNPDAKDNIQAKHVRLPIPQDFKDLARVEQNDDY